MKKRVLAGVLAAAVVAMVGVAGVSAQQTAKTFSIAVHIEYPDGFVYDHAFVTGVPAAEKNDYLAACAQGHRWGAGSVIRFHCYAIPE